MEGKATKDELMGMWGVSGRYMKEHKSSPIPEQQELMKRFEDTKAESDCGFCLKTFKVCGKCELYLIMEEMANDIKFPPISIIAPPEEEKKICDRHTDQEKAQLKRILGLVDQYFGSHELTTPNEYKKVMDAINVAVIYGGCFNHIVNDRVDGKNVDRHCKRCIFYRLKHTWTRYMKRLNSMHFKKSPEYEALYNKIIDEGRAAFADLHKESKGAI